MTIVVGIAMAILAVCIIIGLLQIKDAEDAASQAVVGDLIYFCGVGLIVLLSMLHTSTVVVDAAMLAAMLGILATIALARIITRGRR